MKGKRQIKSLVAFFMATVFTVLTVLSVMPTVSASVGGGITPYKVCNYTGLGTAPDSIEFPEEIIN